MNDTKHEECKTRPTFLNVVWTLLAIVLFLCFLCFPNFEFMHEIFHKLIDSFHVLENSFHEVDVYMFFINCVTVTVYVVYMLILVLIHVAVFFYFSSRLICNCFNLLDKAKTKKIPMPKLEPVPIPTARHGLMVWMHSVRRWRLAEHWKYDLPKNCCVECRKVKIIVPKGFVFDGASIPRPLWVLLHPSGLLLIPALVHDFAYRCGFLWKIVIDEKTGKETGTVCRCNGCKEDWDILFQKIGANVNGVRIVNFIAYWAVRIFGHRAWKKNETAREGAAPGCECSKCECPDCKCPGCQCKPPMGYMKVGSSNEQEENSDTEH